MAEITFRDYLPYYRNSVLLPPPVTTTDPDWTVVNQLVITDDLPAGIYSSTLTFSWSVSNANTNVLARVVSPVTTGKTYIYRTDVADDARYVSVALAAEHSGGPITLTFEATMSSGATGDIQFETTMLQYERKV